MNLEDLNEEDIEFEDEESNIIRDFFTKPSKPPTYEQMIYYYKYLGIDIEDHPELKTKLLEIREKSKNKRKNV